MMRRPEGQILLCGIVALVAVAIALAGCACAPSTPPQPSGFSTPGEAADAVVAALKARDGEQLAALVHPNKGVRFSPYAYVDVNEDVMLSREQVVAFWSDSTVYSWGFADGSGEPIEMTPSRYFDRYVFDRDFAAASSVSTDSDRAAGNTINNAASAYPDGVRIEYYIEPTSTSGQPGLDWAALRLVFENVEGAWFLVGVIHDEWTI
jgi:hypothetical protein